MSGATRVQNFVANDGRDLKGGGGGEADSAPPPPRYIIAKKSPAWLGLKALEALWI